MIEGLNVIIIGVIIGLVEAAARLGMKRKYAPTLSLVLGIAGGVFYLAPGDIRQGVLFGIIVGLSSVGLYSGTKNFKKK